MQKVPPLNKPDQNLPTYRLLRRGLCYALLLALGSVCRARPLYARRAVRRRLLTLCWSVRMTRVLWLATRVASAGARAC